MRDKGLAELIGAVRLLRARGHDLTVHVVGSSKDDRHGLTRRLMREPGFVLHGFCRDLRPHYAACDALVFPSYHEGMANVLLEAAATARPLITTDIPGCREALADGTNGFLAPPRSVSGLAHAMERFLACSPEERHRMGRRSRAWAAHRFDRRTVVEQTLEVFEACTNKTP